MTLLPADPTGPDTAAILALVERSRSMSPDPALRVLAEAQVLATLAVLEAVTTPTRIVTTPETLAPLTAATKPSTPKKSPAPKKAPAATTPKEPTP